MEFRFDVQHRPPTLYLAGRLEADSVAQHWRAALASVGSAPPGEMAIDLSGLEALDGAGVGLIVALQRQRERLGGRTELVGLDERFASLFATEAAGAESLFGPTKPPQRSSLPEQVGRSAAALGRDLADQVVFIGEVSLAAFLQMMRPRKIRWRELWRIAERAGADALPIIALLGFLIGFITAFQSAIPLRRFGAEIFIADLLGLSILRELGPLIAGIILAGRSGSAFAAELGTMKAGEEIDAYVTMGIDPVGFLAVPRIFALAIVSPLAAVFFMLFSLIGGGAVMLSLGFPLVTFLNQLSGAVGPMDLISGLIKAVAFGLLIAGIGCQRGLAAGRDAGAVGSATTEAVVGAIILIIACDGVFAIVYYALGV